MLIVAYLLFLGNTAFGVLVHMRVIPAARFRFVHRLLYTAVLLSLAAAAGVELWSTGGIPWLLLSLGALLLAMPLFRGGSRRHTVYALVCLVLYTAVVLAG